MNPLWRTQTVIQLCQAMGQTRDYSCAANPRRLTRTRISPTKSCSTNCVGPE